MWNRGYLQASSCILECLILELPFTSSSLSFMIRFLVSVFKYFFFNQPAAQIIYLCLFSCLALDLAFSDRDWCAFPAGGRAGES